MRRLALFAAALLLVGCGESDEAQSTLERAQAGLGRIQSGTVAVRATVHALMPIERSGKLRPDELPLSKIDLMRWTRHPRRLACASDLDCARADVDIEAALRSLDPLLPSLPVDPDSIRSARIDVAVAKRGSLPRWLRLRGELDPGGIFPGTVRFELDLELKHQRAG